MSRAIARWATTVTVSTLLVGWPSGSRAAAEPSIVRFEGVVLNIPNDRPHVGQRFDINVQQSVVTPAFRARAFRATLAELRKLGDHPDALDCISLDSELLRFTASGGQLQFFGLGKTWLSPEGSPQTVVIVFEAAGPRESRVLRLKKTLLGTYFSGAAVITVVPTTRLPESDLRDIKANESARRRALEREEAKTDCVLAVTDVGEPGVAVALDDCAVAPPDAAL